MSTTGRRGFSFLEIIIGVCIMTFGLIPLLWALSGGTSQVGITLQQVQAANHASNLLEALRATPFQDLALFPPCMIQLKGGDNVWRAANEAGEVKLLFPEEATKPAPSGASTVFDKFQSNFFAKDAAIVPPLESIFTRYFVILKDDEGTPRYLTVVVRVEWEKRNRLADKPEERKSIRSVELRTVLADPYFCDV